MATGRWQTFKYCTKLPTNFSWQNLFVICCICIRDRVCHQNGWIFGTWWVGGVGGGGGLFKMWLVLIFLNTIVEKHTLKWPFCINFMLKKPCLNVQNLQHKFLDWKWPPPRLELFQKFIRFGRVILPLTLLRVAPSAVSKGGGGADLPPPRFLRVLGGCGFKF